LQKPLADLEEFRTYHDKPEGQACAARS